MVDETQKHQRRWTFVVVSGKREYAERPAASGNKDALITAMVTTTLPVVLLLVVAESSGVGPVR